MPLPAIFNPSNDMALATNVRQYFPPRHIQQMEADLSLLARLWDEGPWGWSLAMKQRYLRMGIPEDDLPTDEWLAELRRLSSREFAVAYYQRLTKVFEEESRLLPCQAWFVSEKGQGAGGKRNVLDWLSYMQKDEVTSCSLPLTPSNSFILKAPWSSSGRGNIVVDGFPVATNTAQRIQHIIHEQGGIVVEPFYEDKVLDFAMEFDIKADGTQFLGYSVFDADKMGHYGGNRVESQDELLKQIGLPDELLQRLVCYHQQELSRLSYRGPVGIDMMRLRDGRVHPCVEMNFRMTMGLLALTLYNKGITNDQLLAGRPGHGFEASIRAGRLGITYHP